MFSDIAGKGIANPTAILRSAILMLEYMGDLGGTANTATFTQNVIKNFQSL